MGLFLSRCQPAIKSQVKRSLLHGSGIRGCHKVYGLSPQTTLNLMQKVEIIPQQKHYQRIEIDEMHSFVGKKNNKVWIFYAYAPKTKEILALTMGKRNRKQLQR